MLADLSVHVHLAEVRVQDLKMAIRAHFEETFSRSTNLNELDEANRALSSVKKSADETWGE